MTIECWDNPLYTTEDRLEMAKGRIKFRDGGVRLSLQEWKIKNGKS
jgi:hypothetical protein